MQPCKYHRNCSCSQNAVTARKVLIRYSTSKVTNNNCLTSTNQSTLECHALQDLFASCHNVAMGLYNTMLTAVVSHGQTAFLQKWSVYTRLIVVHTYICMYTIGSAQPHILLFVLISVHNGITCLECTACTLNYAPLHTVHHWI